MKKFLQKIYKIKIFKRLVPSVLKLYIKIFKKNFLIIKHNDIYLKLNLLNPIDREIYLKGQYEKEQIEYLLKHIKEKKIKYFIDIGAHMGFYSVMISKENLKVYAFEPILNNYSQLYDNKNLNQFDNMEIFNFALSNIEKDIEMWVPDKEKTGGYSIYDREDEEINKYKIEEINKSKSKSKIGDNIIKIENKKIAIKIDVERHEFKVLEGLSKLFRQNEILLQIEVFKERQQKIISYLRDKNFQHINTIEKDFYFKNF